MQPKLKATLILLGFIVVPFGATLLGARFPPDEWYESLSKPTWNPPNWIFGPVWTALYLMMGVSAWLVWKTAGFKKGAAALSAWAVQLALNAAWSWIFFGLHRPDLAFGEIVLLWLAILVTTVLFWGRNAASAVSGLGDVRVSAQLDALAAQRLSFR
ncbi:MAG: TspO/MBR family protein [Planctomycetota bacterium]|jgi:tryptophan-rich sensory protein